MSYPMSREDRVRYAVARAREHLSSALRCVSKPETDWIACMRELSDAEAYATNGCSWAMDGITSCLGIRPDGKIEAHSKVIR